MITSMLNQPFSEIAHIRHIVEGCLPKLFEVSLEQGRAFITRNQLVVAAVLLPSVALAVMPTNEQCESSLEDLVRTFDLYSPPGYFFGANPENVQQFGYWNFSS